MTDPVYSAAAPKPESERVTVDAVLERIAGCVKDISLDFDRWEDPLVRGPGLYFVIEGAAGAEFASPMGTNRWPVTECPTVFAETVAFLETARSVALSCDGAVVVHSDGTIEEDMVRVDQLSEADCKQTEGLSYAGWMGARHMSALETSTREGVIAAITLSEEDGRVTVFRNGAFEDSVAASLVSE